MAKWASATVLDGGFDAIITLAGTPDRVKMHVIKAYSAGDAYATVVTTNSCGSVSLSGVDLTKGTGGSSSRTLTIASKNISLTADSGAGPDLHIAIVDSTGSAVLLVTDETSNQVLYTGNTFACPEWIYTRQQPT